MKYTITIFADNSPGVLYRIAGLLLRKKINIESLRVEEHNHFEHVSHFTIAIELDKEQLKKLVSQIERIIEVREVSFAPTLS